MEVDNYKAKGNKTIKQHNDDLIKSLDILNSLGYIKKEKIYELAKKACELHDIGKANSEFQKRVDSKEQLKMNREKEVPHNVLSMVLINKENYNEEDYYSLAFSVGFHHDYCDVMECVREEEDLIRELLKDHEVDSSIFKRRNRSNIVKARDNSDNIIIKGILHKCDYAASGEYPIEFKNDYLNRKMKEFFDKNFPPNDLQIFCENNSDKNIMVIAQTGMGKTEAGLKWIGNNKGFFILPIRTAINAIYDRVSDKILNNEMINERVALLHSESLEYYLNNKKDIDLIDYNNRGKKLSMPLTVCTLDQIIDFVFKYQGYELKLATLSYSKIVIDEMQMYSPDLLAYLVYGIERICKLGGKVAILTATLAPFIKDLLSNVDFVEGKFTKDNKDENKRHHIKAISKSINGEDVVNKYLENVEKGVSNKILVICNSISESQKIYDEIKEILDKISSDELDNLHILHSRFTKEDRGKLEENIKEFGKSKNENGEVDINSGIWISTSLVEASLDIDFDYLFTELQELSSLFQRFGRCNRKGLKSINDINCYIYTVINRKLFKYEDGKVTRGFIDKDIFDSSLEALKSLDGIYEKGVVISEENKIDLINRFFTTEKLKHSAFMREYRRYYEYICNLDIYEIEKEDVNLRNILSKDVIPNKIYEENKEKIEDSLKIISSKEQDYINKLEAIQKIKQYSLSVPRYEYCKIKKKNLIKNVININSYEEIPVVDCIYEKKGYESKDNDKNEGPVFW